MVAAIKQGRSANSKGTFFFGQHINYSTGIEKPGKYIGLSCFFYSMVTNNKNDNL